MSTVSQRKWLLVSIIFFIAAGALFAGVHLARSTPCFKTMWHDGKGLRGAITRDWVECQRRIDLLRVMLGADGHYSKELAAPLPEQVTLDGIKRRTFLLAGGGLLCLSVSIVTFVTWLRRRNTTSTGRRPASN